MVTISAAPGLIPAGATVWLGTALEEPIQQVEITSRTLFAIPAKFAITNVIIMFDAKAQKMYK